MRHLAFALIWLITSANASPAASPDQATAALIERAQTCVHLAGEFGGNQSARDQEINQQMGELKCGSIARELKALQRRLPKDSTAAAQVRSLLDALE